MNLSDTLLSKMAVIRDAKARESEESDRAEEERQRRIAADVDAIRAAGQKWAASGAAPDQMVRLMEAAYDPEIAHAMLSASDRKTMMSPDVSGIAPDLFEVMTGQFKEAEIDAFWDDVLGPSGRDDIGIVAHAEAFIAGVREVWRAYLRQTEQPVPLYFSERTWEAKTDHARLSCSQRRQVALDAARRDVERRRRGRAFSHKDSSGHLPR